MTASRATVHLAALSPTGAPVADAEFPTRPAGYYLAVTWAQSFGVVLRAGVEGTSSYGAGLIRALQDAGIEVVEINNSDRAGRRHPDPITTTRVRVDTAGSSVRMIQHIPGSTLGRCGGMNHRG